MLCVFDQHLSLDTKDAAGENTCNGDRGHLARIGPPAAS